MAEQSMLYTLKVMLKISGISVANYCISPQIVELLFQRGLVRVSYQHNSLFDYSFCYPLGTCSTPLPS